MPIPHPATGFAPSRAGAAPTRALDFTNTAAILTGKGASASLQSHAV